MKIALCVLCWVIAAMVVARVRCADPYYLDRRCTRCGWRGCAEQLDTGWIAGQMVLSLLVWPFALLHHWIAGSVFRAHQRKEQIEAERIEQERLLQEAGL